MRKSTYLLILLVLVAFKSNTQITQNESFDNPLFLPSGWGEVGAAPNWGRATNLGPGLVGTTHSGAGLARFRVQGGLGGSESIRTPLFDLSNRGSNDAIVSFWIYRDSLNPTNLDSLSVYVNTDSSLVGASLLGSVARNRAINLPDTFETNGWYQYSYNLPLTFNAATNYIIFTGTVFGNRRISIDDISWQEYPAPCSGMPDAGFASVGDTLICGGNGGTTLTLSGASIGTDVTYQWFTSSDLNGNYSPIGTNQNDTTGNITTTMYYFNTVTCLSSGDSANSDTVLVQVSSNPIPIVSIDLLGNDTICRGDSITLIASGADNFVWTAGPITNSLSTITIAPLNNVAISLTGYDSFGCASQTVSQTITVGKRPIIQGIDNSNPLICGSGGAILTVNAVSGGGGGAVPLSYSWSENFGDTNSVYVTPNATTIYTVIVSGQYGCFSEASDTVVVSANPMASFTWVESTLNTINFTNTSSGSTTYSWYFGDGTNSTVLNPTHTYIDSLAGDYQVTLIATNDAGCIDSIANTIHTSGLGVEENFQESKLKVYPNPANSKINIDFTGENSSFYTVKMTNLLGERVIQKTVPKGNKGFQKTIDISNLPTGVYILEVEFDDNHYTQRVIKN